MIDNLAQSMQTFYTNNILTYLQTLQENPIKLISLILDVSIVIFLIYQSVKIVKD